MCSCFYNSFSFERYMFFFNLSEKACLEQNETFSTLKTMICRKYSFEKLTQFSQGNNVLDAAASHIHGFLWRDTCVSSTQLNSPIWTNKPYLQLETHKLQRVFLSKTKSVFTGKQCAICSFF
jgi:hypothetical protein